MHKSKSNLHSTILWNPSSHKKDRGNNYLDGVPEKEVYHPCLKGLLSTLSSPE